MKQSKIIFKLILFSVIICTAVLGFVTVCAAQNHEIYVSPNGSDSNMGTIESHFQALERAKLEVREIKKNNTAPLTVHLRGGNCSLSETLIFGLEDSGNGDLLPKLKNLVFTVWD